MILSKLRDKNINPNDLIIVILPRWGLPVAYTFLKENIGLDFIILPVKKITSPYSEEVAIWAIAPDGSYLVDDYLLKYINIDKKTFEF